MLFRSGKKSYLLPTGHIGCGIGNCVVCLCDLYVRNSRRTIIHIRFIRSARERILIAQFLRTGFIAFIVSIHGVLRGSSVSTARNPQDDVRGIREFIQKNMEERGNRCSSHQQIKICQNPYVGNGGRMSWGDNGCVR